MTDDTLREKVREIVWDAMAAMHDHIICEEPKEDEPIPGSFANRIHALYTPHLASPLSEEEREAVNHLRRGYVAAGDFLQPLLERWHCQEDQTANQQSPCHVWDRDISRWCAVCLAKGVTEVMEGGSILLSEPEGGTG